MQFVIESIDTALQGAYDVGQTVPSVYASDLPRAEGTFYLDTGTKIDATVQLTSSEAKELQTLLEQVATRAVEELKQQVRH